MKNRLFSQQRGNREGLKAAPVANAIAATNLKFKTVTESKEELVHFFSEYC